MQGKSCMGDGVNTTKQLLLYHFEPRSNPNAEKQIGWLIVQHENLTQVTQLFIHGIAMSFAVAVAVCPSASVPYHNARSRTAQTDSRDATPRAGQHHTCSLFLPSFVAVGRSAPKWSMSQALMSATCLNTMKNEASRPGTGNFENLPR